MSSTLWFTLSGYCRLISPTSKKLKTRQPHPCVTSAWDHWQASSVNLLLWWPHNRTYMLCHFLAHTQKHRNTKEVIPESRWKTAKCKRRGRPTLKYLIQRVLGTPLRMCGFLRWIGKIDLAQQIQRETAVRQPVIESWLFLWQEWGMTNVWRFCQYL